MGLVEAHLYEYWSRCGYKPCALHNGATFFGRSIEQVRAPWAD
jgi:hypothetical protein